MSSPPQLLYSCSLVSAHSHCHVPQSPHCNHCVRPGQVQTKHAGRNLIQTNLFRVHITKDYVANSDQVSFHALWQSLIWQLCRQWFSSWSLGSCGLGHRSSYTCSLCFKVSLGKILNPKQCVLLSITVRVGKRFFYCAWICVWMGGYNFHFQGALSGR